MKRLITLVTVLLIGLASVHAAQTDDQQKKKKKKAQTTQAATPAPKKGTTQTSKKGRGTQTSNRNVQPQTSNRHVSSQTSNQQVVKKSYVKPGRQVTSSGEELSQAGAFERRREHQLQPAKHPAHQEIQTEQCCHQQQCAMEQEGI